MKHAKKIVVKPDAKRANILLNLNRQQLRILTMFLTGHGIFKEHLKKIGVAQEKECRFCNDADESAEHLLSLCSRFDYERCILFGNSNVTLNEYSRSDFRITMRYLRTTKLLEKFIEFDMRKE